MLNFILNGVKGLYMYRLQEQAKGLGVVFFIGIVLMLAYWDRLFQPICDALGITKFAEEIGLIQSNSVMTFIVTVLLAVTLLFLFAVLLYVPMILKLVYTALPKGLKPYIFLPFLLPFLPIISIIHLKGKREKKAAEQRKIKEVQAQYKKQEEIQAEKEKLIFPEGSKVLAPFIEKELTEQEAQTFLNKAYAHGESAHNYVVAYMPKYNFWYVFGVQPLPQYVTYLSYYGFKHLYNYEEAMRNNVGEKESFFVPTQPIFLQETRIEVASPNVTMHNLSYFSHFYQVKQNLIDNFFKNVTFNLPDKVQELHLIAYTLPVYFEEIERQKRQQSKTDFLTVAAQIPNYDAFKEVYRADVEYFLKHALLLPKHRRIELLKKL